MGCRLRGARDWAVASWYMYSDDTRLEVAFICGILKCERTGGECTCVFSSLPLFVAPFSLLITFPRPRSCVFVLLNKRRDGAIDATPVLSSMLNQQLNNVQQPTQQNVTAWRVYISTPAPLCYTPLPIRTCEAISATPTNVSPDE